jgi:hypothetical protein
VGWRRSGRCGWPCALACGVPDPRGGRGGGGGEKVNSNVSVYLIFSVRCRCRLQYIIVPGYCSATVQYRLPVHVSV